MPCANRLGGPGTNFAATGRRGTIDSGHDEGKRAQAWTGEHPQHEADGQRDEEDGPTGDQEGRRLHHDPGRHQPRRDLVHRVREAERICVRSPRSTLGQNPDQTTQDSVRRRALACRRHGADPHRRPGPLASPPAGDHRCVPGPRASGQGQWLRVRAWRTSPTWSARGVRVGRGHRRAGRRHGPRAGGAGHAPSRRAAAAGAHAGADARAHARGRPGRAHGRRQRHVGEVVAAGVRAPGRRQAGQLGAPLRRRARGPPGAARWCHPPPASKSTASPSTRRWPARPRSTRPRRRPGPNSCRGAAPSTSAISTPRPTPTSSPASRPIGGGFDSVPRSGTATSRSSDLAADVVETRAVQAGQRAGYRQVEIPADGHLVLVTAGTAHGVEPLADGLSPFHFARRRLELLEPPHMHTSMLFVPDREPFPQVGDQVDVQRPLITHAGRPDHRALNRSVRPGTVAGTGGQRSGPSR